MVNVGVLGATGMVGQRFIQLLDKHPDFELTALAASSRSAGKRYEDATTWYLDDEMPESVKDIVVCETNPEDMDNDVDIVFSSLPTEFAAKVEKDFAKDYVVASNASAHRMKKNIPLVIPEVNPEYLDMIDAQQKENNWDGFIVTNPNCSTIALTLTLKPIVDNFNVNSIRVSTMQAVLKSYAVEFDGYVYSLVMPNIYSTKEFEDAYTYEGKDLGLTYGKDKSTFKVWAPTADKML